MIILRNELDEKIDSIEEDLGGCCLDWTDPATVWPARLPPVDMQEFAKAQVERHGRITTPPNTVLQNSELRARQRPMSLEDARLWALRARPTPMTLEDEHLPARRMRMTMEDVHFTTHPQSVSSLEMAMVDSLLGKADDLHNKTDLSAENIDAQLQTIHGQHNDSQQNFWTISKKLDGLEQKVDKLAGLEKKLDNLSGLEKKLDNILNVLGKTATFDPRVPVHERVSEQDYEVILQRLEAQANERPRQATNQDERLPISINRTQAVQAFQGFHRHTKQKKPSYEAKKESSMGQNPREDYQGYPDFNLDADNKSGFKFNTLNPLAFNTEPDLNFPFNDAFTFCSKPVPNPSLPASSARSFFGQTNSGALSQDIQPDLLSTGKSWESRKASIPNARMQRQLRLKENFNLAWDSNYKPASAEAVEDGHHELRAKMNTHQPTRLSTYDQAVISEDKAAAPPPPMATRKNKKHQQQKTRPQPWNRSSPKFSPLLGINNSKPVPSVDLNSQTRQSNNESNTPKFSPLLGINNGKPVCVFPSAELNSQFRQPNHVSNTAVESAAVKAPEYKRFFAGVKYPTSIQQHKQTDIADRMMVLDFDNFPINQGAGRSSVLEPLTPIQFPKGWEATARKKSDLNTSQEPITEGMD